MGEEASHKGLRTGGGIKAGSQDRTHERALPPPSRSPPTDVVRSQPPAITHLLSSSRNCPPARHRPLAHQPPVASATARLRLTPSALLRSPLPVCFPPAEATLLATTRKFRVRLVVRRAEGVMPPIASSPVTEAKVAVEVKWKGPKASPLGSLRRVMHSNHTWLEAVVFATGQADAAATPAFMAWKD
ncbi:hypothetical protein ABZP36_029409 [Zizania latifolia]